MGRIARKFFFDLQFGKLTERWQKASTTNVSKNVAGLRKNNLHHDKAETLRFVAKLFMRWYLAQDAFYPTFTVCNKM